MKRASTVGRPRRVTDEQVAAILAWHEGVLALKTLHAILKSIRKFAAGLGLSTGTVSDVIRRRGAFKQACPSTNRR
jgi:transposase